MAQLFKTISLEERLRNSRYNELPLKQQEVQQGESNIRLPQQGLDQGSINLKGVVPAQEKRPISLKNILATQYNDRLPQVKSFTTFPLLNFEIPEANTKFRTKINLANRLDQPNLETTNHLPQFFLADLYTDYITIQPFGIFNHTSTIVLDAIKPTPNQGGLLPNTITFVPNHTSQIVITNPIEDVTTRQGTVFSNGAYNSLIVVSYPIEDVSNLQGIVQLNGLETSFVQLETPQAQVNQGPGVSPINSVGVELIQSQQGIVIDSLGKQSSIISIITPGEVPIEVPSSIIIQNVGPTPEQGGTNPVLFDFNPNFTTPILEVLKYAADRALAFFTPRIKHGSAILSTRSFSTSFVPNQGQITLDPAPAAPLQADALEQRVRNDVSFPPAQAESGLGSLSSYKALSYDQIVERSKSPSTQQPDFRITLGIPVQEGLSVNNRARTANAENDFIDLQIDSMTGQGSVKFVSYVTSFSDNFNIAWNDINYIGRQDTLKAFKGTTRGGSVAFKVVAMSKQDLGLIYNKLNRLIKIAGVGKATTADNTYITGPLCQITVGNWFNRTPCIFNSIKYDIQTTEYSWDIDDKMPHLVDVSLDFVLLGDRNGNPLNASTNDYFKYIG